MAGFIIGSLGVLNDVTVTQASTAFELAEHGASRRAIFVGAMRVGRDHIASTVYTLVLAYAGSALPLLMLFSVANRSLGDVLTSENVAIEIARSAVGGNRAGAVGPLTTAIAAVLATPQLGIESRGGICRPIDRYTSPTASSSSSRSPHSCLKRRGRPR